MQAEVSEVFIFKYLLYIRLRGDSLSLLCDPVQTSEYRGGWMPRGDDGVQEKLEWGAQPSWCTAQASVRCGPGGVTASPAFTPASQWKGCSLWFSVPPMMAPLYLSVFYNPRGRSRFCLLRAEATIRVLPPGFTVQGRDTGFECGDSPYSTI